jgi:RNA polymerase sigma factor (sigma-70 family)
MATAQLATVLSHLRQLADVRRADALPDAELLARFVARRDEPAFGALLQRHGPMVLGVCRRILRDPHDAEDAFQATFLVLVRKASSIGRGASLGYWLYEVAYRTALRAKLGAARRRQRERQATAMTDTDPPTDAHWEELRPLLDEELHRLPEKYREPFVLCYLQGKTHPEAAELLGWPRGTVSGRLARARELLRGRLARRGVTLTAGVLVTALAQAASAALPRRMLGATLKAALRFGACRATGGFASVEAVTLAKGVLQGMSTNKLKLALAVLLTVGALGGGAVGSAWQAGDPKAPPAAKAAAEAARLPEGATARLGTSVFRHGDRIFFIAYTPDGKHLITASRDQTVRLWDAATGKELRRFDRSPRPGEKAGVADANGRMMVFGLDPARPFVVALAPDGKTLAAASGARLILWDVASGKELRRLPAPPLGASAALGFADGGKKLVLAVAGSTHAWDTATGKRLKGATGPAMPAAAVVYALGEEVLSPDGKLLARGHFDPTTGEFAVKLTEVATGKELPPIPFKKSAALAMTFSPDGKTLAWATPPGGVQFWDLATRKVTGELPTDARPRDRVSSLAFSADGKALAVNRTDGRLEVWDVPARKRRVQLGEPAPGTGPVVGLALLGTPRVAEAAFSPDGKTLAFCSGSAVRLMDVATGKVTGPAGGGHREAVSSLGLPGDGKTLLTHARGDAVLVWDAATGKRLRRVHVPGGTAEAALSPDGAVLAVVAEGPAVALYEPATGKELRKLAVKAHSVSALAFSADGKTLAARAGAAGVIQLWDVASGKPLKTLGEEPKPGVRQVVVLRGVLGTVTRDLALSPDGKLLAAGGGPNQIRLWDTATGRVLRELALEDGQVVKHVAFAPDGRSLAVVNQDGTAALFEAATGGRRGQFGKPDGAGVRPGQVNFLAGGMVGVSGSEPASPYRVSFSPDGRLLAAASEGPVMRLWDVRTGKEAKQLRGHQGGVVSLGFARDGNRLVSGSLDTTALVWDTAALLAGAAPPRGGELQGAEAKRLWDDLAAADAGRSFEAVRRLWGNPGAASALLRERLQRRVAPDAGRVTRLLGDLDSKSFAARQKATGELEKLGELVEPELRAALAKARSVEMRQRLERLLKRLDEKALPGELLRDIRAVEVLERLGTAEARGLLRDLAGGAPAARLTREAQAALQRLEQRAARR